MRPTIASIIVEKIISDLNDRSGLGNEWELIDDETRKEIKQDWEKIVNVELDKEKHSHSCDKNL